ncbi:MAG: LysR family transcriptional regulator [Roseiarcus sp.]|jgi:DNA-binding transcriptional LysR family regulator
MSDSLSWDEFRLVKAIADARSLGGAADALGLNHSTIFRRLAAIEQALGARLFERSRAGYQPTAAGEEMAALATGMADSVVDFERRAAGRDVEPSGELRVTTADSIAVHLLAPVFARFRKLNPGVYLDVILASHQLNLARRDADVAIRATNDPPETLVGRRIGAICWAVYATPKLALEFGPNLLTEAPWIGFGEGLGAPTGRRWIDRNIGRRRQGIRANSLVSIAEMIAAGAGAGVLPCFVGDSRADLTRFGEPIRELDVDLWVLTHPDMRHAARVRAFTDHVGGQLMKLRKRLEGA